MISTQGLVKNYPQGKKIAFPDLQLNASERLLIHGPSGSGKTSLLHILAGLIKQDEGSVEIDHQKMELLSSAERDHFRGKNIGICLQKPVFIHSLTVIENIYLSQKLASDKIDKLYALSLLEELGLSNQLNQKTYTLSQGEQQRLMLIRALVNKPKLILADEPSSALDDHNTELLTNLMIQHSSLHQATLIVVTHDDRLKKMFDHKMILS